MTKTREEAFLLLQQYTTSESLLRHALSVEGAMLFYGKKFEQDEHLWGLTGLLHDFDYERFPDPNEEGHPFIGSKILKDLGYPPELIEAILGHAHYTGVKRESLLAKCLFACDELTGLITASALVRPDRSLQELQVSSVKKKMKDKAFARSINRDDIQLGAEELGIALDEHIENVIQSMRQINYERLLS